MNLILNNLAIRFEDDSNETYLSAASAKLQLPVTDLAVLKILSKNLDIRDHSQFMFKISLVVSVPDTYPNREQFPHYLKEKAPPLPSINIDERPVVVGFGPAGMFAALELIKYGYKPLIFERGAPIGQRIRDVESFIATRSLNPESNIQFGEGGAGSFSDGKLFSRRNKNTSVVNRVLKTFVMFGAPPEIEYISKPHLGTDVLRRIVKNIRTHILDKGGSIQYNTKLTDLIIRDNRLKGLVINDTDEYPATALFLAIGHSARDTYTLLQKRGVSLEQKKISIGVRIEHPVEVINRMRYGEKYAGFPGLGAATYSLNHTDRAIKRGVYTFCMCPGGEIVNASSENEMLVLNGMSYSDRALPYSNGALVVTCHQSDYGSSDALAGISFQQQIEQQAYMAGGGNWKAPAQNLLHFLRESSHNTIQESSYRMQLNRADMDTIFPDFITRELRVAIQKWRAEVPLFVSEQALLLGAETRTSSPVRISRNKQFESLNTKGLYPIGEGAGYTGGITSSAADGIKAIEHYTQQ